MHVTVSFYSYFRDLTGCAQIVETLPEGCTLDGLFGALAVRFPKIAVLRNSALMAVGVEYLPRSHVLREGNEVSLFPPVQGG